MRAKFLRIDSGAYPQLANAVMAPSFAKELTALVKHERDAAYSAGAEQMREKSALEMVKEGEHEYADMIRNLPVGESSRAPEGSTK